MTAKRRTSEQKENPQRYQACHLRRESCEKGDGPEARLGKSVDVHVEKMEMYLGFKVTTGEVIVEN